MTHKFQIAIDKINEIGLYKAKAGQKPYRLLHKLAKSLGIYMHGSQRFIGKHFKISARRMDKMSIVALTQYCTYGVLQVPDEFKYNDNHEYRHDGEANANRNIWRESNNASNDRYREEPVQYSLNTVVK